MATPTTTIIVPLDESTLSEAALPVADELAGALTARITVLTAGWGSTTEALAEYLTARAATLTAPHDTVVVPDTFPATAIADAARGGDDLVVMATHGRSGIGKALLGSVAEDVLKRSERPVVLVGPHASAPRRLTDGVLAVTTDGSPASAMILPSALVVARALSMAVRVVSVHAGGGTPLGGNDRETVDRALESAVAFFAQEGIEAASEQVMGADAGEAVAEWAGANAVALLAMSTHGRTGLARATMGSTAMKCVHDSPCPVLVRRSAV